MDELKFWHWAALIFPCGVLLAFLVVLVDAFLPVNQQQLIAAFFAGYTGMHTIAHLINARLERQRRNRWRAWRQETWKPQWAQQWGYPDIYKDWKTIGELYVSEVKQNHLTASAGDQAEDQDQARNN